ncbi:hypothetical protein ABBQ32_010922 [Trebouxia sp. C0010 RCD-2024]
MLSLRMASSLNRCVQLQSGRKAVRSSFTSVPVPPLQRPPLKSLQSRNSRTLACQVATASDVGQGASHDLTNPHTPVLLSEVLAAFSPVNLQTYVDGTLGAAGHAQALLQQQPECKHFIGIDMDPVAHALAEQKLSVLSQSRFQIHLLQGNFGHMKALLQQLPGKTYKGGVDGVLLDLGISSMQVDQGDRGFSFSKEAPLDMRMGPGAAASAEQLLNTWSEAELGQIFREYGEERHWKGIASRVVRARQEGAIKTTTQLVALIGGQRRSKPGGGKQIHPATRVFQALRIAVNQELQMLEQAIPAAIECLAPQGRLAIISFHSLEDRIVKRAFLKAAGKGPAPSDVYGPYLQLVEEQATALVKLVNKKPITPGEAELRANPRSRSAKLRVVEKLSTSTGSPTKQE